MRNLGDEEELEGEVEKWDLRVTNMCSIHVKNCLKPSLMDKNKPILHLKNS